MLRPPDDVGVEAFRLVVADRAGRQFHEAAEVIHRMGIVALDRPAFPVRLNLAHIEAAAFHLHVQLRPVDFVLPRQR